MSLYDIITGSSETINYVSGSTIDGIYADSNAVSIMGPIWLPRVYGKDLTAFEIASSGKIAITINDVHSLDFSKTSNLTQIATKQTDSLQFNVNSSNMLTTYDSSSNNITIYAASNILQSASNDFFIEAFSNASMLASNGSLSLMASQSNMTFVMDNATKQTTLYSSNDINEKTSNNWRLTAVSDVNAFAQTGSILLAGSASNTTLTLDGNSNNVNIYTSNNTTVTASNNVVVTACNNVTIGSSQIGLTTLYASNVSLVLNGSNLTTTLYSSNDISLTTSNNTFVKARSNVDVTTDTGSIFLKSYIDKSYLKLDNKNINVFTSNDFVVASSNDILTTAQNQVVVTSINGNVDIVGHNGTMEILMNASNDRLSLTTTTDGIDIGSATDMNISACNGAMAITASSSLNTTAGSHYSISADGGQMSLSMSATSHDMTLVTASNFIVNASSNITLNGTSNVFINTDGIRFSSSSNAIFNASNNVLVSASNNLTLSASNLLTFQSKDLSFNMSGDTSFTAQSNVSFFINGAESPLNPVFNVTTTGVNLRGDLYISGTINTSNINNTIVNTTTLKVEDKLVYLASTGQVGDSNPIETLQVCDGAGIQVDGIPAFASNQDSNLWPLYEKSLKWKYGTGNGTSNLATDTFVGESAWELCGGGMRLVSRKNVSGDVKDLSFTFRIGVHDELELVKTWWSATASNYVSKRVARFGRIV
jgi:uncharacterized protein (DUF2345 family)